MGYSEEGSQEKHFEEKNYTNNTAETGIINWGPMEIYETLGKMYAYGYLSWR